MEYRELKSGITEHLNSAAEDFFMVGYFLRQISENALFTEDGYKNIWDFAKGEYGLSTSSASRFMAINARFSIDGGEHMAEKYIGMGVSKLQEMLGLPDEELEKVTQETTVREIRAMKAAMKEPLSFFGLPKTVRPEGSLLTTPGCGDGKYDCFTCSRPCSIRQEPRQCVVSTCGNPKPCGLIDDEEWQKRMGYSLYKDDCQMLHHELAPIREGDQEPSPCCRNCENKTCFNRCDVAKAEDEEAKKKAQAELQKQRREAEAKKPEPSDADIKAFCKHENIRPIDNITATELKDKLRNAGGGGGGFDFQGSARGIRINYKREITWAQLVKRIKEIQEKELQQQEKENAPTEAEYLTEFYEKDIYPSTRILIKDRDKAAITKLFKQEYGSTYENGTRADGSSYSCYPDKIVFRSEPGAEGLQITWGRFVTKLLKLLEEKPEIEQRALDYDAKQRTEKEPDIIDADFREVEDEPEPGAEEEQQETLCEACAHEGECVGEKTQDDGCMGYEEKQELQEADPEQYGARDIREVLRTHEADLKAYREVDGLPEKLMKKQRILVDALTLLLHETEQREIEAEGGGEDD
ncbi:MAG: hypothetical protein NC432_15540 [Roseburia sp.]|nr:hypothetical protein [Roseburia sp.]MCM1097696.1 hypothetical protein [Ruminococcus flavefaciens]